MINSHISICSVGKHGIFTNFISGPQFEQEDSSATSSVWSLDRKREYLDNFARSNRFDPLSADRWYSVTSKMLPSLLVSDCCYC